MSEAKNINIESWIVHNIKRHHNSLIPDEYLNKFSIEFLEEVLTYHVGEKVTIRSSKLPAIRDAVYGFVTQESMIYVAEAFNF